MRSDLIKSPVGEERIVRAAMSACRYARLRGARDEALRGEFLKIRGGYGRHSGGVRTDSPAMTMADVLSLFPAMTVGGK
jgi:hypothetical protein